MLSIFILLSETVLQGFSQALIQRSNELTEEDNSTIFYVNLGWSICIYSVLFFLAPYISIFYKQPELTQIARILFLGILTNALMVVYRAKLTIKIDFKSQAIAGVFATLFSAIFAVYLAKNNYNYWALVGLILSRNIFLLLGLFLFSRWLPKWIFSKTSFRSLFKFGSNIMFASIVATIVNNLSVLLIGRYFNPTHVGYFTQATNLSNYASQFVSSTLQGVTYPVMTSVKNDREQLINIYKKLISITMLISLPLLVGFASISSEVILLFLGDAWEPAISILIALCFARAITPISAINMNILNAIGRSDLFLKVDLSKLPLSFGGLIIAIPFGIKALAWMSVATSFLAFFINAYYPAKFFKFGGLQQIKVAKNYILASGTMYFVLSFVSFNSLITTLITKILAGIIIYIFILFILRDNFFLYFIKKIKDTFTKNHEI